MRAIVGFFLVLAIARDVQTTMVEKKKHNLSSDINAISAHFFVDRWYERYEATMKKLKKR